MKKIAAALFILGIPWLLIVVPLILSPIGIFMPEYDYKSHDIIASLLLSACGLLGIMIWIGYRLRWKTNDFIWITKKQFWTLSLVHHAAWIFLIPRSFLNSIDDTYWISLIDFWIHSGARLYGSWIILSIFVAVFALIYDRDSTEKILAEQAAPSNH